VNIYAIGDLQGCLAPLEALLRKLPLDGENDRLWFVGDLVNRGPQSLETLRFVKNLGERAVVVLGNHDLHLLCVAEGFAKNHAGDTLDPILQAPDRDELLHWLRHCPLMHTEGGYSMVHAGVLPEWSLQQARLLAGEVEDALRGPGYRDFLKAMYGNKPSHWNDSLSGMDRLRVITNGFTRIRLCTPDGHMEFSYKGELKDAPLGYLPWYALPQRKTRNDTIIFGHWSALGLQLDSNILALDTGCLWGRHLTAVRLSDRMLFQVPCEKRSHHG
jgi:bis(5'-nucleosyl)-tetraphosphatase (symmetrical)